MSGIFAAGRRYLWNVLIGVDQLGNALLGGDPDETVSSRMGKILGRRKHRCRVCRLLCRLLDKIDPNHCAAAIETDEGGRAVR